jgi:hypothetical protein
MTTNRLSLAPTSNSALLARIVPAFVLACLAAICHAAASPWRFVSGGGMLRLLRSPRKLCCILMVVLNLTLDVVPPDLHAGLYPEDETPIPLPSFDR